MCLVIAIEGGDDDSRNRSLDEKQAWRGSPIRSRGGERATRARPRTGGVRLEVHSTPSAERTTAERPVAKRQRSRWRQRTCERRSRRESSPMGYLLGIGNREPDAPRRSRMGTDAFRQRSGPSSLHPTGCNRALRHRDSSPNLRALALPGGVRVVDHRPLGRALGRARRSDHTTDRSQLRWPHPAGRDPSDLFDGKARRFGTGAFLRAAASEACLRDRGLPGERRSRGDRGRPWTGDFGAGMGRSRARWSLPRRYRPRRAGMAAAASR